MKFRTHEKHFCKPLKTRKHGKHSPNIGNPLQYIQIRNAQRLEGRANGSPERIHRCEVYNNGGKKRTNLLFQKLENMKTLTLTQGWETENTNAPKGIKLILSPVQEDTLRKHLKYATDNGVNIEVPHNDVELFGDPECKTETDYRAESKRILITASGGMYFTAVNKHNYSESFESESFEL